MEHLLLNLLRRPEASTRRTAVVITPDGWAAATVRRPPGARPLLESCYTSDGAAGAIDAPIGSWLAAQKDSLGSVSTLLAPDEYQLLLVEAPDVLPAELKAAIRWRLKDLIDFPVEEAVIDVFDIPDQARRAGSKMMYAVAARRPAVERRAAQLAAAKNQFDVIDVTEMALRNLAAELPESKDGLILLWLERRAALLILVKGALLYLSRRVEFHDSFEFGAGAEMHDVEAIALELQRSIDYFESHYEQAAVSHLIVAPTVGAQSLMKALVKEAPMRVQALNLSRALDMSPGATAEDGSSLLAVGAALRHEKKSL